MPSARKQQDMNLENFHDFLNNPSNLHRIGYQELKSLVLQHPYSQNLRLLLLIKSRMEKHPDFDRNLQLAAAYSVDRSKLFQILQNPDFELRKESVLAFNDDFLELKDLADLETLEKIPKKQAEESEEIKTAEALNYPNWADELTESEDTNEPDEQEEPPFMNMENFLQTVSALSPEQVIEEEIAEAEIAQMEDADEDQMDWLEAFAALSEFVENKSENTTESPGKEKSAETIPFEITNEETTEDEFSQRAIHKPLPKTSFTSWLQQFEKPQIGISYPKMKNVQEAQTEPLPAENKKKTKKKSEADKLAELSLLENDEIISETLAELLVTQDQKEKAIVMFEKLRLKFPEKSSLFAARIENLKKS